MSKLSRKDILKLAELSALSITDEEAETFAHELSEILSYVETLNTVDITGLEPTYQVTGLTNVTRPDVINKDVARMGRELLLKNAPAQENGQFKVKRVLG